MECPYGKRKLDKKGALTMKNSMMEIQHIEMRIYECPECNYWHLTTVGKHQNIRGVTKNKSFYEKLYGKKR